MPATLCQWGSYSEWGWELFSHRRDLDIQGVAVAQPPCAAASPRATPKNSTNVTWHLWPEPPHHDHPRTWPEHTVLWPQYLLTFKKNDWSMSWSSNLINSREGEYFQGPSHVFFSRSQDSLMLHFSKGSWLDWKPIQLKFGGIPTASHPIKLLHPLGRC